MTKRDAGDTVVTRRVELLVADEMLLSEVLGPSVEWPAALMVATADGTFKENMP